MAEKIILAIAAIVGILIGVVIFKIVVERKLFKKVYVPDNATALLKMSMPEVWNEVRIQYSKWVPCLKELDLSDKVLPSVDFHGCNLVNVSFENAFLDGADFSSAKLNHVTFKNASLVGGIFDHAHIVECDIKNAKINNISVEDVDSSSELIDYEPLSKSIPDDSKTLLEFITKDPDNLDKLNPKQFEKLLLYVFKALGFSVQEMAKSHQKGFDYIFWKEDPIYGHQRYIVEAKKTPKGYKVGLSSIRTLYAQSLSQEIKNGILVTTTDVTYDARRFADKYSIRIINRDNLLKMIQDINHQTKNGREKISMIE